MAFNSQIIEKLTCVTVTQKSTQSRSVKYLNDEKLLLSDKTFVINYGCDILLVRKKKKP